MAEPGVLQVGLGLDQKRHPIGDLALGLGTLSEVGITVQRERAECSTCEDGSLDRGIAMAYFKIGSPEGALHKAMPAFSLIFRKNLPQSIQIFSSSNEALTNPDNQTATPTAAASLMISKSLSGLSFHLGADLLAAQRGEATSNALRTPTIRPIAALHFVPSAYPDTTLLADVHWIPSQDANGEWGAVWNGATGVRYKALDWASVDLNIRLQEHQGAGDALVVLGARGTFDLGASL
tara:strand:- start:111010 stop:111717 length:708 start_codon:yes stop_codon:yes gene_type:complete